MYEKDAYSRNTPGRSGCGVGTMVGVLIAVLVAVVVVALAGFFWYRSGYDRAVTQREAVDAAWAQVENQLQRRYDLIPNLVSTVKGYAAQEKGIFENIARYRTEYFQAKGTADKAKAANQLEGVLSRLLLLREAYPVLKSNENFLSLQDELAGTENRVAVERKRYNDAVRDIKTYSKTFFGSFFCRQAGVRAEELEYFQATGEAQKGPPRVEFDP